MSVSSEPDSVLKQFPDELVVSKCGVDEIPVMYITAHVIIIVMTNTYAGFKCDTFTL